MSETPRPPTGQRPIAPSRLPSPTRPRRRAIERTLRISTVEGMAAEVVTACAGGAALTAWALYLGCDPLAVALLGALPSFAQVIQLPSACLTSTLGGRRVAIVASAVSRISLAPLILLPFLALPTEEKRVLLLGVAAVHIGLGVVGSNGWITWMGEVVPARIRGRYFGRRASFASLSGSLMGFAAGVMLDRSSVLGMESLALSGLAALATIAGLLTQPLLRRQHEPARPRSGRVAFRAVVARVLRDPASRRLVTYQMAWNAAIGVSASFFAVHLLTNLHMGFMLVAGHAAAAGLVRVLVTPAWGRAIDRKGAKPILALCSFGLFAVPLVWLAPPASALPFVIAADALVAGTLWAGHGLAAFQLPLSIAPPEQRPFYLAAFATAGGLSFALAAGLGGIVADALPPMIFLNGRPVLTLQLLFLLSAAGRLASAPLSLRLVDPARRHRAARPASRPVA